MNIKELEVREMKMYIVSVYDDVKNYLANIRSRMSSLSCDSHIVDTKEIDVTSKLHEFIDSVESLENTIEKLRVELKNEGL